MLSNELIDELRNKIKPYMSIKRYKHTLGVESTSVWLGELLAPDKLPILRASALLHDIAKDLSRERQIDLIKAYYADNADAVLNTVDAALHCFAASQVIKEDFPQFYLKDILNAINSHTLGSANMGIVDEIIFLADFIEPNREFASCKQLRSEIIEEMELAESHKERLLVLHKGVLKEIDFTIGFLNDRGITIDRDTLRTREYINSLI